MTTLPNSPPGLGYQGVEKIRAILDGVANRRWLVGVIHTMLLWGAVSAGGLMVVSLCGYWPDQPPRVLRLGLFVLLISLWIAASWMLVRSLLRRSNIAQTARFIETHAPGLRNDLINSVLLSRDTEQTSPALVQCAIRETLLRAGRGDLRQCVSLKPLRNVVVAAAVVGAMLACFIAFQPGVFRRGVTAVLQPTTYVPANNTLRLLSLAPGDTEVFTSSPATIHLKVRAEGNETIDAEVVIEDNGNPRIMHPVTSPSGEAAFAYRIAAVHEPLQYFVRARAAGRQGRWPTNREWFTIRVSPLGVESRRVRYEYPAYTHLGERESTFPPNGGEVAAPAGSWATLTVRLNRPVERGVIERPPKPRMEMDRRDGGRMYRAKLPIRENGNYRIVFYDEAGRERLRLPDGRDEAFYTIRAAPDAPPTIAITKPRRDVALPAGESLPIRIEAADDYSLTNVQLLAETEKQSWQPVSGFTGKTEGKKQFSTSFPWPMSEYAQGDVIVYRAVATDNRRLGAAAGPQTTQTPTYRIRIRNPAKAQADRAGRLDELKRRLLDLLQRQTGLRARTAILPSTRQLPRMRRKGKNIYGGQKRIHADLDKLPQTFPFEPSMDDLRKAIISLADNEADLAVAQARAFITVSKPQQLPTLCEPLLQTQEAMITTLQEMLAILPARAKRVKYADQKPGDELSPDPRRAKREQLAEAMKQFIADQKKIIAASRSLAKKAVDDFTHAEQKRLDELIARQDQWEKFLNEAFADFSKLAEQDFANPSLLKELLSVRAEVAMAKNALKAKAVEIATACEDNGIENAETLTANLEKWLPDEPDRKKWMMEAPLQQDNIEQAELPTELEDLMGELLEDQEDLFEEMDDVSSKATMSGDKGIGWDAMDGPISNMNAQGVTGNQLPNTSEIQGRSGEGRTGKSSGEFVEDKAVGKAGRRTPTRLGNDPFQQGQVKDTSAESPGGATGGGKVSSLGAEGLEGPTPAPSVEQRKRLAGRQASIVNRAERIAARLKIGDYSAFRMDQAVLLMNRVKRDLDAGDYQNALHRRNTTLRAIRKTREILTGDIDVRRDTSKALTKNRLDEITDVRPQPQPREYREAVQQYYQRLSETLTK